MWSSREFFPFRIHRSKPLIYKLFTDFLSHMDLSQIHFRTIAHSNSSHLLGQNLIRQSHKNQWQFVKRIVALLYYNTKIRTEFVETLIIDNIELVHSKVHSIYQFYSSKVLYGYHPV